MKVVILAGGLGTRIAEETSIRPKPMVEIGDRPILRHIMDIYSHFGFEEFIIACGYKGHVIKEYFHHFYLHENDIQIDLQSGSENILSGSPNPLKVSMVNTGLKTMTGGRLLRLKAYLSGGTFMVTYGDGLADVDLAALHKFHLSHGKLATITAVHPASRFGALELDGDCVREFSEKPQASEGWINGGFFVFEPGVFDYLNGDDSILERQPLEKLSGDNQLMAFKHQGFWQPMDTVRERDILQKMWETGKAPWRFGR